MNVERKVQSISEDIDLLLLVEKLVSFFRRYFWIFLAAVVFGLFSGWLAYRSLSNVYRSRLVLHSFLLTNPEQIQLVNNWSALLSNGEKQALASIWNCRVEIIHHLKRIKAEEIQKVFTTDNPNGFFIEVTVTDNSILPELEKGILFGLRNGEYIRSRLEMKRANLLELMNKTAFEIQKLDSMKFILEQIITGDRRSANAMILDGSTINRQIIELNEKRLNYKNELQFADAVQVLQSFNRFDRPTGPKLVPWLIIGLVAFLAIASIIAFIDTIRLRMKIRAASSIS